MVLFEPCSEDNYKTDLALGATFTIPAVVKSDPAAKVKLGEQTAGLEYGAILLFRQDYPLLALCGKLWAAGRALARPQFSVAIEIAPILNRFCQLDVVSRVESSACAGRGRMRWPRTHEMGSRSRSNQ
jgi:hypothetical protein